MAAYQQGDVAAFEELVSRHEKPLWNFLRRLVRDPATAEDLLQETFMRVIKSAPEWKPTAKFSTWLYTIGRNLCIDHARSKVKQRVQSLDGSRGGQEPESGLAERIPGCSMSGETATLTRELAAALDRAIQALPEAQREVFVMREVLDLSFAEIAEAVGASEPTVKSRMRYALERLREQLHVLRESSSAEEHA